MPPPPPPPSHHHHDHPPPPKPNPKLLSSILKPLIMTFITSIFFLILGFVAFLLFLILAAGALHRRRTHSDHPSSGFSPRHFKTLPQLRFRLTQNQTTLSDCVVCLDAFRDGQWCRKLPACGHLFHRRCLDTWLVKVSACPICRTPVVENTAADGLEEEEAKRLWNFNRNTNSRVW